MEIKEHGGCGEGRKGRKMMTRRIRRTTTRMIRRSVGDGVKRLYDTA